MTRKEALAQHARDYYENYLNALPNVVGTGIVSKDESKPGSKRVAVAVYVSEKKPRETLKENELIPEYLEIRKEGRKKRIPIRVIEQGHVTKESEVMGKEPL